MEDENEETATTTATISDIFDTTTDNPEVTTGAAPNISEESSCFQRVCDQSIIKRNLPLPRAIQILENEEYLEELEIVRSRRFAESREFPKLFEHRVIIGLKLLIYLASIALSILVFDLMKFGLPRIELEAGKGAGIPSQMVTTMASQNQELFSFTSPLSRHTRSLVPPGHNIVAVFPPFNKPRTRQAAAIIFQENRALIANRKWRPKRKLWKSSFRNKSQKPFYRTEDNSSSLFGFVACVRLVQELCELGFTCDERGNPCNPEEGGSCGSPIRRQTGQQFSSNAPIECRTEAIDCNEIP